MNFKNLPALLLISLLTIGLLQAQIYPREDTLYIPKTSVLPLIDGTIDQIWDQVEWQMIDQVWMPWNNLPANLSQEAGLQIYDGPDDFTGKFKVLWSSETNLLYFLVEIVDDVFVDGYVFPAGGYPNYDIVEVFIDEDRSGGPHVFNNILYPGMSNCPTCNAENAFAYHLAANAPDEGEVQTGFYAVDMSGSTWGTIRNYADHFPDFAMTKTENTFIWEFSLIVHNDSYNHSNQAASVVTLETGKIMGLSMAYCDNDNPNESSLQRDHFFGSVEVPIHAHNDHWINADWFGVAKLTGEASTSSQTIIPAQPDVRVFFSNEHIRTQIVSDVVGPIQIRVLNILGSEVYTHHANIAVGSWNINIPTNSFRQGIYLVEIVHNNKRMVEKISIR